MAAPTPRTASVSHARRKEGQSERHVPAEPVPVYEESNSSLRSCLSRLQSPLIGRSWPYDLHGVQGSLGRQHFIWDIASPKGQGSVGKNEGGMEAEGKQYLPQCYYFCFTGEERTLEKLQDLLKAMHLASGSHTPSAHMGRGGVQGRERAGHCSFFTTRQTQAKCKQQE